VGFLTNFWGTKDRTDTLSVQAMRNGQRSNGNIVPVMTGTSACNPDSAGA
jgi:hypothetical protein